MLEAVHFSKLHIQRHACAYKFALLVFANKSKCTKYAALRKLYLQIIYIIYSTARMDYAKSSGLGDDHGTEVE
jgi:hypothetical protein